MKMNSLKKACAMAFSLALMGSMMVPVMADEKEPLEITVVDGSEPSTLDPNEANSNDSMAKILHLYEGLMRYSPSGEEVEYGQAESYDVSEDGLTYTFHLRDGITWSDGQPVTAGDFVYSWQRLVSGGFDNSNFIDMVKNAVEIQNGSVDKSELGVEATDDKTLVVTLKNPCVYFPQIVAAAVTCPVRQDMVESGDQWYASADTNIGNGPFKLDEWANQDHITMVANENYFEADAVGPTKLTWSLMDDDNTILASFESGDIMYASTYPTEEYERLNDAGYVHSAALAGTYYIEVNSGEGNDNPALADPKVRRALALAIDRNYIVDTIKRTGEIAADTFIGDGFEEGDGVQFHEKANKFWDNDTYEANCEEAKQLLADAGYPNGEGFPTLKYSINNGSGHQAIAEYLQSCWSEVLGIEAQIDSQEWAVVLDMRESGDYQMARAGWTVDFFDPASLFELWNSWSGNNDAFYNSSEYDDLIAKAQNEPDPAARFEYLHQAEDVLGQDLPVIPLYYYSTTYLADSENYDGYFIYLGLPMFKYTTAKAAE